MLASTKARRFSPTVLNPVLPVRGLAERVHQYFARHPEVSPEEFLRDAVGRKLSLREGLGTSPRSASRPPLTGQDVRTHVRLVERLAELGRERYRLWPKIRRFLFGSRLVRWLAQSALGRCASRPLT